MTNTPPNQIAQFQVAILGVMALVLLPLTACSAGSQSSTDSGYRTIPAEPGRDIGYAREQTNLGVTLLNGAEAGYAEDGDEAQYLERLAQAERHFRDALQADIMYGPAHNNLGRIYYLQERYYEAAWEFQYAAQLMPHRPIPRNNLGLVFEATGQLDKAEEHYALALASEPDNPEFLSNLARAKVRRGERSEELLELLQQIIVKDSRPEWRRWAEEQQRFIAPRLEQ